jgi:hypothetical protein
MAKNSQMRTILLCGGILLVVLFFLGVFKMKEGFQSTKCADRTNKTGCEDMDGCSWSGSSNNISGGGTCKVSNCALMDEFVCKTNSDKCTWTAAYKTFGDGDLKNPKSICATNL